VASDRLVLDASYALELVLPTQATWQAEAVAFFDRATLGDLDLVIPAIFFAEMAAVLARKVRGRVIAQATAEQFLEDFEQLAIALDVQISPASALFASAQRWQCGAYDAIYVELALQLDLPIATRDRGMVTAARAAGVPIFATA
jgi:predicted nucleic acid-binding protein